MRKTILISALLAALTPLLGACSTGEKPSEIELPDIAIGIYPSELRYEGNTYRIDYSAEVTYDDITGFLGYWINADDLEMWQEHDHDEDMVYVLEENNDLVYYNVLCEVINDDLRYRLYWTENEGQIAMWDLKFYPYQLVESED